MFNQTSFHLLFISLVWSRLHTFIPNFASLLWSKYQDDGLEPQSLTQKKSPLEVRDQKWARLELICVRISFTPFTSNHTLLHLLILLQ
jgi:hypothetical protein